MDIYKVLNLDMGKGEILSFVGAGGKTTTIFQLAKELKEKGKKVLITTTTKIDNPINEEYDHFFIKNISPLFKPKNKTITIYGQEIENKKMIGITLNKLEELANKRDYDFILIEADGANRKSIKAPAKYEPVVSKRTDKTIGMIGLDCINKVIQETVHRYEIFTGIVEKRSVDTVDEESITKLIINNKGLFKETKGRKVLFLNKANENNIETGRNIRNTLLYKGFDGDIILGDIIKRKFY